jgi:DNA-binding SARP family transcriptional activator
MELHTVEEQTQEVRRLAADLLRQGERCIAAGLISQAEVLLAQVWTMANGLDTTLADHAAWNVAWLLVHREAYADAAEWFSRIVALPTQTDALWPIARQGLEQLCRLAGRSGNQMPASALRPLVHLTPQPEQPAQLLPLKIIDLARFQVIRAETSLPACKARKSIGILRYLLTRPYYTANKDELIEVFWPDTSPRKSAHNLHVAVSALRHHLDLCEESYLLFEAGNYMINPAAPLEHDCAVFLHLSDEADRCRRAGDVRGAEQAYTCAIAIYQGDYDVDDRDLIWAITERERLLARYLSVLEHLGRILIEHDRFELALDCYQRLLERDNYREDICGQLMHCYWQLGRRGEALRYYERSAEILAKDLGLEPAQELQALYRAISNAETESEKR